MNVNEHCQYWNSPYPKPSPRIYCWDGFSMSVQAREYVYCRPRNDEGPWTAFEVGYPSEGEPLLMEYAEDADRPTDTVYGYVPIEVIERVIEKHGGACPAEEVIARLKQELAAR